jgi:predicted ATPase
MYIDSIALKNFRAFRQSKVDFVHPDQDFKVLGFDRPKLPNVNLLLGNNGKGKTTLLKSIALAAMGPAVGDSGIFPYRLIRREPEQQVSKKKATIRSTFTGHPQDQLPDRMRWLESEVTVMQRGDLESLRWTRGEDKAWQPIYSSSSDAFFFVGYGANRRVEKSERVDHGGRSQSSFTRAQRVQSLFEETYSLIPLNSWLPKFQSNNHGRYKQILGLINRLLGLGNYTFSGDMEGGEYLFEHGKLRVPFPALSDGYRAFLGWVGDLLYHVAMTCPKGTKLVENRGIVMVDEIDLHLHPEWQMTILPTLATELPNLQFIVTSHSPLIVGSLEWMNIIVMTDARGEASDAKRIEWSVHGLDADQVLLTDFFGLESTRATGKRRRLKELTMQARTGDSTAAKLLIEEMSRGAEDR